VINIELNRQTTLAVIILAASLFSSVAFALPNKMPINGRLTFSNDTDINGTANFTFKIYNNKTGSAALWQESQQNLTVRRGLFSAYLGNNTPINLTFDENYFLEIVVNGETIEPRFDFGTTGYSFASNQTLFTKNDTKVLGNLTPVGNNSALGSNSFSWLAGYFNSLIAGTLNVTDIFLGGFNLTSRIVSDNATQGSRIDVLDTRQASDNTTSGNRTALLETKQSADNTTQASLIAGNNLSTVSILCPKTSGSALKTVLIEWVSPLKSGVNTSIFALLIFLISFIVSLKVLAPPSLRSSLVTDVITAYFKFKSRTASATLLGS